MTTTYKVVPRDYSGWQQPVTSTLNTPPGGPTEGNRYLVGTSPTDAWVGHAGNIATYNGTTWDFAVPAAGWYVYDIGAAARKVYSGSAWAVDAVSGEVNTASNAGTGSSIFYQKSGVDLQFNGIAAASNKIGVSVDAGNHNVTIDVNQGNVDHNSLSNYAAANHRAVNFNGTTNCVEITI